MLQVRLFTNVIERTYISSKPQMNFGVCKVSLNILHALLVSCPRNNLCTFASNLIKQDIVFFLVWHSKANLSCLLIKPSSHCKDPCITTFLSPPQLCGSLRSVSRAPTMKWMVILTSSKGQSGIRDWKLHRCEAYGSMIEERISKLHLRYLTRLPSKCNGTGIMCIHIVKDTLHETNKYLSRRDSIWVDQPMKVHKGWWCKTWRIIPKLWHWYHVPLHAGYILCNNPRSEDAKSAK